MATTRFLTGLAFACSIAACARSESLFSPGAALTPGTWGANDVSLVASDSVTELRIGCDAGQFAGHITPDANGRFASSGTWTQNFQAYFYSPHPVPAQLSGSVNGGSMTIAVAAASSDGKSVVSTGPWTVVLGAGATFAACGV
jgi:hypothetical protein